MKRLLIPFFLLLILVLPVSASSELAGTWVDLFDYSMPNDGTSYYVKLNADNPTCWFDLPYNSTPYYVDFVYVNTGKVPSSITCTVDNKTTTLTNVLLGDYVYRCYGRVGGNQGDRIYFTFNGLTGSAHITFKSIHYSTLKTQAFPEVGTFRAYSDNAYSDHTMSSATDFHTFYLNPTVEGVPSEFRLFCWFDCWDKYDYMDINLNIHATSITSINAYLDNIVIPYEINYIGNPSVPTDQNGNIDGSITGEASWYYVSIRCYLDSLRNVDTEDLTIAFSGTFSGLATIGLDSITGYVNETIPNPITILWNNMRELLTDLLGGSDDDKQNASDFNDSVTDQSSELEDMTSIMDSVQKPVISDINMSVDGMVDTSVVTLTTSGFSAALSNEIFIRVLLMVLTLALVGFILYGKKG